LVRCFYEKAGDQDCQVCWQHTRLQVITNSSFASEVLFLENTFNKVLWFVLQIKFLFNFDLGVQSRGALDLAAADIALGIFFNNILQLQQLAELSQEILRNNCLLLILNPHLCVFS